MLTAAAVARQLGISARTVYALAESGTLACYRFGSAVRFDPADVEAYRASCRSAGTPATSAGASSWTAAFKAAATDLAACFRAAGVRPRLTPTTAPKAPASTRLRLAHRAPIP